MRLTVEGALSQVDAAGGQQATFLVRVRSAKNNEPDPHLQAYLEMDCATASGELNRELWKAVGFYAKTDQETLNCLKKREGPPDQTAIQKKLWADIEAQEKKIAEEWQQHKKDKA